VWSIPCAISGFLSLGVLQNSFSKASIISSGIGGDCSHIDLNGGFILKPNMIYYGNSQWIHESLPLEEEIHRNLIRITLPLEYQLLSK
jgi:hypothetical protein